MKLLFDLPKTDIEYRLDEARYSRTQWNKTIVELLTAVLSITLYVGGFFLWPVKPEIKVIGAAPLLHVLLFFVIGISTLIAHEVFHLAAAPGGLFAKDNAIGLVPKKFLCYSYTKEPMGWGRVLFVLWTPLTLLSIIPCLIQFTVGLPSGWLGFMAIANASFAANDIIIGLFILFAIPRDAVDVQPNMNGVTYAI